MVSFGHPVRRQDAKEKPLIIRESTVRHHKYNEKIYKIYKYKYINNI